MMYVCMFICGLWIIKNLYTVGHTALVNFHLIIYHQTNSIYSLTTVSEVLFIIVVEFTDIFVKKTYVCDSFATWL